jgi:hypothetical protein
VSQGPRLGRPQATGDHGAESSGGPPRATSEHHSVPPRPARDFDAHLADILAAPTQVGRLELIVGRPGEGQRVLLDPASLDLALGLVGDNWRARGSNQTVDGGADPEAQVTVVNTRALRAIEPDRPRWPLAGDQLYVDFNLSIETLPPGSRLAIGSALIEVTPKPHAGCAKYSARFGSDALRWINSPVGRANRLRGLNARILIGGVVRTGDLIRRV